MKKPYTEPKLTIIDEVKVLENVQEGILVKLKSNPSGPSLDITAPNQETELKLYESYKYLLNND